MDEMTPLVSHPLRNLTPQQENLARKLAARKRPAALISQQKLTMIGGDNQAGSQFSTVKRMMRKQNLLGRTARRTSPRDVDFAVLSTQQLRKEPGLNTVLRALALYRQARARENLCACLCVSVWLCLCVSVSLLVNMSKQSC